MPYPLSQLARTPCLSDPAYLRKCSETIREKARTMALYGDLAMIIADEWDYAGRGAAATTWHSVGKGCVILLNFGVGDYQGYRASGVGGEVSVVLRARAEKTQATQALLKAVLAAAGLSPRVTFTADPAAESGFLTRFRNGDAVFLGMACDPKESRRLRFSLAGVEPSERHLYDVRAHKYLGCADSFEYTMKDSFAEIIALMPARIGDVSLKAAQAATERGKIVSLTLKITDWKPEMGRPVFHVDVRRPDGVLDKLYSRNVVGQEGWAEIAIPLALNDPTGAWQVGAREVISGNSDTAKITVR